MRIGVASENRPMEKRVIVLPEDLAEITAAHDVIVERGAGEGIGVSDSAYEAVGANIGDTKTVYACTLVVRLKEPKEEEFALMKPGSMSSAL